MKTVSYTHLDVYKRHLWLCSLFRRRPVVFLLLTADLFKWLSLIAINIKLVITFNWRTAEHIHILFGFYHEATGGKQRALDGADPVSYTRLGVAEVGVDR